MTVHDLVQLACQNDEEEKAFTEYVHDKNFNITCKNAEGLLLSWLKKPPDIINLDASVRLLKISMG